MFHNVVRGLFGARANPDTVAIGISVEADTAVTGNVVEDAGYAGLSLGWGRYARNITATGNVVRRCGRGIAVSVTEGAGSTIVASNMIAGASRAAIIGMDHDRDVTDDLTKREARPPDNVTLSANAVSQD